MNREEAIKRLEVVRTNALIQKANGASEYWQEEIDGTIEAIDMAIEALSADVVRCKECRWWQDDYMGTWCGRLSGVRYTNADDFCSHGERKGGDSE